MDYSLTAELALWSLLTVPVYLVIGYPITLLFLSGREPRHVERYGARRVTIVIAAYNEVVDVAATVLNKLGQDYPRGKLEVVVVSDASTDGTDEAVAALNDERVTLLRQEPRQGKTSALNRAVAASSGEIIIFADANSEYAGDAIARLVDAFADGSVGYVTGRLVYREPGEGSVGAGSGLYMQYENWLRRLESRVGSIVGVNGGIDAVRRELYEPMRPDHLPDFILPLRVVERGYRVIYCPDAVCTETALGQHRDEFRMRVRVGLRALHALWEMRHLLRPRFGLFAFQLLVHKVLRYLIVLPMAGAFLANAFVLGVPLYRLLFGVQCVFYILALLGWVSGGRIRIRPVFVPFYFCLVNLAAAWALVRFLRGERQVLWTPRKGA